MGTPGSKARAAGLITFLISVSAGINIGTGGGFGLLLCFAGVLTGASLIAVGVRMAADDPAAPVVPAVFVGGPRALAASLRRNLSTVGLVMASCAVTAVSGGEAGPVLCFVMLALLVLGLSLINIGVTGE
ncbi:unnamed protein product [Urochloa decumbens]|uniref:Uncharacterized protein n=1 Tax=Urochloa decumbens TaxID=240449 RepID=A0ABC9BXK3_9POAL